MPRGGAYLKALLSDGAELCHIPNTRMPNANGSRTPSATNPEQLFESLQSELQREIDMEPNDRNKKYKEFTLQHFLEHGRKTEEHDLWRECHMLAEMASILKRRFLAHNPHKRREAELKEILTGTTEPLSSDHFKRLYDYEQGVDLDGRSQQEMDGSKIQYPSIDRLELEILAAENYLYETWKITRKQIITKTSRPGLIEENKKQNTNPIMNWRELSKELKKAFHSDAAIRKAVKRSIDVYHGKQDTPWPMSGCASEHQIVATEIKRNKEHPTPASCKYQRISQDKILNLR